MKLVDANIFIYAVGRPHEYRESCVQLSAELVGGGHDANVDTELFQEILFFFWRRDNIVYGLEMFDRLASGFPDPFPITVRETTIARSILSTYAHLQPRDAIHAAVVLRHGLEGIISTDRGFDGIPGVTRFDPKDMV